MSEQGQRQNLSIVTDAYRLLIRQMREAVFVFNERGDVLDANPAAEALLSQSAADFIGQSAESVFAVLPDLQTYLSGGDARGELISNSEDASYYYDFTVNVLYDVDGNVSGRVLVLRDTTEEKRTAEVTVREANLLRLLVDYTPDMIYIKDTQSRFVFCNVVVAAHMGAVTPDGLLGKTDFDFYPQELAATFYGEEQHLFRTGEPIIKAIEPNTGPENEAYWMATTKLPLRDDSGAIIGLIGVSRNITAERHHEKLSQQYAAQLEERNRQLYNYSHTVAHDLKAPLTTIAGYADLLMLDDGPKLSQMGYKYLQTILTDTLKMNDMINNLLMIASLDDIADVVIPVDMTPLAWAAVQRFQAMIERRAIEIDVMDNMPMAMGNKVWIEEVFANLIGNAIKYIGKSNPSPQIRVHGFRLDDRVRYEVQDNGIGIAPENQAALFEMFSRFHRDEASGLGLGLAIVLGMISKLDGQVGVDSIPGQGSTFWFTLRSPDGSSESLRAVPDFGQRA
jgi:PAS domain S-box-containing protein